MRSSLPTALFAMFKASPRLFEDWHILPHISVYFSTSKSGEMARGELLLVNITLSAPYWSMRSIPSTSLSLLHPKITTMEEGLLGDDDALRDTILKASLYSPIQGTVSTTDVDALLDVAKHGRFKLQFACNDEDDPKAVIEKVRRISNLG